MSFFRLQPELDQAAIAAKPFAQREATAALSHGIPLVQSHCYFPFAFSLNLRDLATRIFNR